MAETELFVKTNKSQGSTWEKIVFWKLAIVKCGCLCMLATTASITASLNGIDTFGQMTNVQITLAIVAVVAANASVILAFVSDTMTKLNSQADAEKKSEIQSAVANRPIPPETPTV